MEWNSVACDIINHKYFKAGIVAMQEALIKELLYLDAENEEEEYEFTFFKLEELIKFLARYIKEGAVYLATEWHHDFLVEILEMGQKLESK